MTRSSDQGSRSTSLPGPANKTAAVLLGLENDSARPDRVEPSRRRWDGQVDAQFPLLPRSSWQDQQAFLRVLIRAKRSLDIAEINAYFD